MLLIKKIVLDPSNNAAADISLGGNSKGTGSEYASWAMTGEPFMAYRAWFYERHRSKNFTCCFVSRGFNSEEPVKLGAAKNGAPLLYNTKDSADENIILLTVTGSFRGYCEIDKKNSCGVEFVRLSSVGTMHCTPIQFAVVRVVNTDWQIVLYDSRKKYTVLTQNSEKKMTIEEFEVFQTEKVVPATISENKEEILMENNIVSATDFVLVGEPYTTEGVLVGEPYTKECTAIVAVNACTSLVPIATPKVGKTNKEGAESAKEETKMEKSQKTIVINGLKITADEETIKKFKIADKKRRADDKARRQKAAELRAQRAARKAARDTAVMFAAVLISAAKLAKAKADKAAETAALADWQHGEKVEKTAAVLSDIRAGEAWESWMSPDQIKAAKAANKAQAERLRALCHCHVVKSHKLNPQRYHLRKWAKKLNKNITAYYLWLEFHDIFNAQRIIYRDNAGIIFNVQRFAAEENNNTAPVVSSQEGGTDTGEAASAKKEERKMFNFNLDRLIELINGGLFSAKNKYTIEQRNGHNGIVVHNGTDTAIYAGKDGSQYNLPEKKNKKRVTFRHLLRLIGAEEVAKQLVGRLGKDAKITKAEITDAGYLFEGTKADGLFTLPWRVVYNKKNEVSERWVEDIEKVRNDHLDKIEPKLIEILEDINEMRLFEDDYILKVKRNEENLEILKELLKYARRCHKFASIARRYFEQSVYYAKMLEKAAERCDFVLAYMAYGEDKVLAQLAKDEAKLSQRTIRRQRDFIRNAHDLMNRGGAACKSTLLVKTKGNIVIPMVRNEDYNDLWKIFAREGKFHAVKALHGKFKEEFQRYSEAILSVYAENVDDWGFFATDAGEFREIYRPVENEDYLVRNDDGTFSSLISNDIVAIEDLIVMSGKSRQVWVYSSAYSAPSAGDFKNGSLPLTGTLMRFGENSKLVEDKESKAYVDWRQVSDELSRGMTECLAEFEELCGRKPSYTEIATLALRQPQWKATSKNLNVPLDSFGLLFGKFQSKPETEDEWCFDTAFDFVDGISLIEDEAFAAAVSEAWRPVTAEAVNNQQWQDRMFSSKSTFWAVKARVISEIIERLENDLSQDIIKVKVWEMTDDDQKLFSALAMNKGKISGITEKTEVAKKLKELNDKLEWSGHLVRFYFSKEAYRRETVQGLFDMNGLKSAWDIKRKDSFHMLGFVRQHDEAVTSSQMFRSLLFMMYSEVKAWMHDLTQKMAAKKFTAIIDKKGRTLSSKDFRVSYREVEIENEDGTFSKELQEVDIDYGNIVNEWNPEGIRRFIPLETMESINKALKSIGTSVNNGNLPIAGRHYMIMADPCAIVANRRILRTNGKITEFYCGDTDKDFAEGKAWGSISYEEVCRRIDSFKGVSETVKQYLRDIYKNIPEGQCYVPAYEYIAKAGDGWDFDGDSLYIYKLEIGDIKCRIALRYPKTNLQGFFILQADEALMNNEKFETLCVDIHGEPIKTAKKEQVENEFKVGNTVSFIPMMLQKMRRRFNQYAANIKVLASNHEAIKAAFVFNAKHLSFNAFINYMAQKPKQVGEVVNAYTQLVDLAIHADIVMSDKKFCYMSDCGGEPSLAKFWHEFFLKRAQIYKKLNSKQTYNAELIRIAGYNALQGMLAEGWAEDITTLQSAVTIIETCRKIFNVKPYLSNSIGLGQLLFAQTRETSEGTELIQEALILDDYSLQVEGKRFESALTWQEDRIEGLKVVSLTVNQVNETMANVWNRPGDKDMVGLDNRLFVKDILALGKDYGAILRFMAEGTIDQVKKPIESMMVGMLNDAAVNSVKALSKTYDFSAKLEFVLDRSDARGIAKTIKVNYDCEKSGKSIFKGSESSQQRVVSIDAIMHGPALLSCYKDYLTVYDPAFDMLVNNFEVVKELAADGVEVVSEALKNSKGITDAEAQATYDLYFKEATIVNEQAVNQWAAKIKNSLIILIRMWRSATTAVTAMQREIIEAGFSKKSVVYKVMTDHVKMQKRKAYAKIINTMLLVFDELGINDADTRARLLWLSIVIDAYNLFGSKMSQRALSKVIYKPLSTNLHKTMLGPEYMLWISHMSMQYVEELKKAWEEENPSATEKERAAAFTTMEENAPIPMTFDKVHQVAFKAAGSLLIQFDGQKVEIKKGVIGVGPVILGYIDNEEMTGTYELQVRDGDIFVVQSFEDLIQVKHGNKEKDGLAICLHAYQNFEKGSLSVNAENVADILRNCDKVFLLSAGAVDKGQDIYDIGYRSKMDKRFAKVDRNGVFARMKDGELKYLGGYQGGTFTEQDCAPALAKVYNCGSGIQGAVDFVMPVKMKDGKETVLFGIKNVKDMTRTDKLQKFVAEELVIEGLATTEENSNTEISVYNRVFSMNNYLKRGYVFGDVPAVFLTTRSDIAAIQINGKDAIVIEIGKESLEVAQQTGIKLQRSWADLYNNAAK